MKKFFQSLIVLSLIHVGANAQVQYLDQGFENEIETIDHYLNAMLNKHFKTPMFQRQHPQMDMSEDNEKYILKFNVAGYTKEQIKLTIEQNMLTLSGEMNEKKEEKSKTMLRREMQLGKFTRSVRLPNNVDLEKLETKYENGILNVTIAKKIPGKSTKRVIPIQ